MASIVRKCRLCRAEFEIDEKLQAYLRTRGFAVPSHCPRCRFWRSKPRQKRGRAPAHMRTVLACAQCVQPFEATVPQIVAHRDRGLPFPDRCDSCCHAGPRVASESQV